jgi:hypothetical protein
MAVGGLGVSLGGFAGVIASLGDRSADSAVIGWRIRNIVIGGFIVSVAGFGVVAIHAATEDVSLTVRLSSLLIAIAHGAHTWWAVRPGSEWQEGSRLGAIIPAAIVASAFIVNVVVADVGLLHLLVLALLIAPVSIFVTTIRDVAQARAAAKQRTRVDGTTSH